MDLAPTTFVDKSHDFRSIRLIRHHGTVVAVAEDAGQHLYASVLDLARQNREEAERADQPLHVPIAEQLWNEARYWTPFTLIPLPAEVRVAGANVLTMRASSAEKSTAGAWSVLSDGTYVYLFRSLEIDAGNQVHGVYGNRFALVEVAPDEARTEAEGAREASAETVLALRPKVEARFTQSGLADLPANAKDSLSTVDRDGKPCIEPTLFFHRYLQPLEGHFTVCLTPGTEPGGERWQFLSSKKFGETPHMVSDAFGRLDDGWPDVTDHQRDDFIVSVYGGAGDTCVPASFDGMPDCLVYRPQILVDSPKDDDKRLPGEPRLFVASQMAYGSGQQRRSMIVAFDLPLRTNADGSPDIPVKADGTTFTLQLPIVDRTGKTYPNTWVPTLSSDRLGVLDWLPAKGTPQLLDSADGSLRLYVQDGGKKNGPNLRVAEYDTTIELPLYEIGTKGSADKLVLQPTRPPLPIASVQGPGGMTPTVPALVEVTQQGGGVRIGLKGVDRTETWAGLPNDLDGIVAILGGRASHDPFDPRVIADEVPFYDYELHKECRLAGAKGAAALSIVEETSGPLQLASVTAGTDNGTSKLTIRLDARGKGWGIDVTFANLPADPGKAAECLRGTLAGYDYARDVTVRDAAGKKGESALLWIDTDAGSIAMMVPEKSSVMNVTLSAGGSPSLCSVSFRTGADSSLDFASVPRDASAFRDGFNKHQLKGVTRGSSAEIWPIILHASGGEVLLRGTTTLTPVPFKPGATGNHALPLARLFTAIARPARGALRLAEKGAKAIEVGVTTTDLGAGGFVPKRIKATDPARGSQVCSARAIRSGAKPLDPELIVSNPTGQGSTRTNRWIGVGRPHVYMFATEAAKIGAADDNAFAGVDRFVRPGGRGDLTVEAWVQPSPPLSPPGTKSRQVVAIADATKKASAAAHTSGHVWNVDTTTGFALALSPDTKRVGAQFGHQRVSAALPTAASTAWTHLAAVWTNTSALSFDGTRTARAVGTTRSIEPGESFRFDAIFQWSGFEGGEKKHILFEQGDLVASIEKRGDNNQLVLSFSLDGRPKSVALDGQIQANERVWVAAGFAIFIVDEALELKSGDPIDDVASLMKALKRGNGGARKGTRFFRWAVGAVMKSDGTVDKLGKPDWYDKGKGIQKLKHDDGQSLRVGRGFRGTIASLRLWDDDGGEELFNPLVGGTHKVRYADGGEKVRSKSVTQVSRPTFGFSFAEGHGRRTFDDKGEFELELPTADMWTPSSLAAKAELYGNGERLRCEIGQKSGATTVIPNRSPAQMGLNFKGSLREARVWSTARAQQQIVDLMYTRATGGETGLAACWHLDEGSCDDKVGGFDLVSPLDSGDLPVGGHGLAPPTGRDLPLVRSWSDDQLEIGVALHGLSIAAAEYGEIQRAEGGQVSGALKRCYACVRPGDDKKGRCCLVTGMGIGELDLRHLAQVQTDPELIGYVEGAPPVPSENLTTPYYDNPRAYQSYVGTTSVALTEAEDTVRTYSADRDLGVSYGLSASGGPTVDIGSGICAGLGVAVKTDVFKLKGKGGVSGSIDDSFGMIRGATAESGSGVTLASSIEAAGNWEKDPTFNPRYVPANVGYALVVSRVADLYGLHLRGTGALLGMQIVPAADIEPDANVIIFPINPRYTKQGSLDGKIGFDVDPEFAALGHEERSYYRPREAYDLEAEIARQEAELDGRYRQFGRSEAFADTTDAVDYGPAERRDWARERARRNLVNTYVWTAAGGLYAEQEHTLAAREESWGSRMSATGSLGAATEFEFDPGVFIDAALRAGIDLTKTVAKRRREADGFTLSTTVTGEGFLSKYVSSGNGAKGIDNYERADQPGKVLAYRFKTFYLGPEKENFRAFFDKVVDPAWLAENPTDEAAVLRSVQARANRVWRVMHRVTHVSRVAPQLGATVDEAEAATRPIVGVAGNRHLLALVRKEYPKATGAGARKIAAAVQRTLDGMAETAGPWKTAGTKTRDRIGAIAVQYVLGLDPESITGHAGEI